MYSNFALLLSLMQGVTDYLLTLQNFDFDIPLDINAKLRQKVKTSHSNINIPE